MQKAGRSLSRQAASPSSGTNAPRLTTTARPPRRSNLRTRPCAGGARRCAPLSQQNLRRRPGALVAAPNPTLAASAELERRDVAPRGDEAQIDGPCAVVGAAIQGRLRREPAEEPERLRVPRLARCRLLDFPVARAPYPDCLVERHIRRIDARDEAVARLIAPRHLAHEVDVRE